MGYLVADDELGDLYVGTFLRSSEVIEVHEEGALGDVRWSFGTYFDRGTGRLDDRSINGMVGPTVLFTTTCFNLQNWSLLVGLRSQRAS